MVITFSIVIKFSGDTNLSRTAAYSAYVIQIDLLDFSPQENGYMCGSTNAVRGSCFIIFPLLAVCLLAQRTVIRN